MRIVRGMPLYHFTALDDRRYDDPDGTELADDGAARQEALLIIRELRKNNETACHGWSMEVTEGGRRVWQIPFVGAD
jgi:hypothetical protein